MSNKKIFSSKDNAHAPTPRNRRVGAASIAALMLATAIFLCGCDFRNVDRIALDVTEKTVSVGEAFKITATATGNVEWSSDDEDVILVNGVGTVTAIAPGTATVIARCGVARATCYVIVEGDVSEYLTLDIVSRTVKAGESFTVVANTNIAGTIAWRSSDNEVAAVAGGIVTAKKAGEATITASIGSASATCKVVVQEADEPDIPPQPVPDEVTVNITEKTLDVGQSFYITATPNKAGTVTWRSSDTNVATVNGGTVKAIAAGKATITASFGTASATTEVTVNDPEIFDLTKLNNAGVVANVGKWYYWAGGSYSLTLARYDHGTLTLAFDRVAANDTYQLRYQPFEAGVEYKASFTVSLSAAGTVRYGVDNLTETFAAAGSKKISYEGTTQADMPFMVQVKPSDANKPVTLTLSDVSFVRKTESPYICDNYADDFSVGAAVLTGGLNNYAEQLRHFNSFTPENDMKWKFLEATEGKFTFANADKIVSYAKSKNAGVRGHCLVWYKSLPSWLTAKVTDRQTALDYMNEHIELTMKHFGGDIYVWDVCNEALRNAVSATQLKSGDIYRTGESEAVSGAGTVDWYKFCGTDFIKQAFETAGRVRSEMGLTADDMKLYYNDYSLNNPNKRAACVELVKMLRDAGVPIDGVGMQSHYRLSAYTADKQGFLSDFEASVKAFTELGIDVQITELDIRVYANDGAEPMTDEELENAFVEQGEMYGEIFKICKKYAEPWKAGAGRITNVTTWGVSDSGTAWDTSAHKEYPFIFDKNKNAKPAVKAILDAAK